MAFSSRHKAIAAVATFAVVAAALAPIAADAATSNTTINATVNTSITVASSGTVSLTLTPGSSPVESSASDAVTVNTNDTNGYTLTLADADTNTSLVSGANTIPAASGTWAAPALMGTNKWGYAVAGSPFSASYAAESSATGSTYTWAGVPSSAAPQTIKTTSTTASNDTTTIWYGVQVDNTQPSGVSTPYSDQIVYTATAN